MAIANAFFTPASFAPVGSKFSDVDSGFSTPHFTLSYSAPKLTHGLFHSGIATLSNKKNIRCASIDSVRSMTSTSLETDAVPMPIVLIDQDSDSDAKIVEVSFGDRLGALIDTMKALKDLGLDVVKGTVNTEGSVIQTKFFITLFRASGRKVEDPDLLERIRLTIINNLLKYHPLQVL